MSFMGATNYPGWYPGYKSVCVGAKDDRYPKYELWSDTLLGKKECLNNVYQKKEQRQKP